MDELIKLATTQGVWAVLSCLLIVYILKKQEERDLNQEEREKKYQNIIQELIVKFNVIDSVDLNIKEIKNTLNKITINKED